MNLLLSNCKPKYTFIRKLETIFIKCVPKWLVNVTQVIILMHALTLYFLFF